MNNKDTGSNSVASYSWNSSNFLHVLENVLPKNPDYSYVPINLVGIISSHSSFWTEPLHLLQIQGLNTIHTARWQQNSY